MPERKKEFAKLAIAWRQSKNAGQRTALLAEMVAADSDPEVAGLINEISHRRQRHFCQIVFVNLLLRIDFRRARRAIGLLQMENPGFFSVLLRIYFVSQDREDLSVLRAAGRAMEGEAGFAARAQIYGFTGDSIDLARLADSIDQ